MPSSVPTEIPNVLKSAGALPMAMQETVTSSISSLFHVGTWKPARNEIGCGVGSPVMTTGAGLDVVFTTFAFTVVTGGAACPGSVNATTGPKVKAANANAFVFLIMAQVLSVLKLEGCPS